MRPLKKHGNPGPCPLGSPVSGFDSRPASSALLTGAAVSARGAMADRYVRASSPGHRLEWIEHLDGTEWYDAPIPRRWHRCWPQTRARLNGELIERCACGALAFDGDSIWIQRNTRRRAR